MRVDPQVDDPEPPVVNNCKIGARPVEQGWQVEKRNGHGRVQKQGGKLVFAFCAHARPQGPKHQKQPEHQTGRQQHLPASAKVQVFGTLVTKPEPPCAELVVEPQEFTRETSEDNEHQSPEQDVHTQLLSAWFAAPNPGHKEEASRYPGGGDPEHGQLQMNGAKQSIGQKPGHGLNAIEGERLDAVMGQGAPGQCLQQEQECYDYEVLAHGALARGQSQRVRCALLAR